MNRTPRTTSPYNWLIALVVLVIAVAVPAPGQAQEPPLNQAGLVIRYSNERVTTACVRFPEASISGMELLERAGVPFIAQSSGLGAAVCKIGGQGCDFPTEDCFCKCKGAECAYWAYQRLSNQKWAYSPVGAASVRVLPGEVDGWAWGPGNLQSGTQPPVLALEQICSVAQEPTAQPTTAEPATPTEPPATATLPPAPTGVPATATLPAAPTGVPATATLPPAPTGMPATATPPPATIQPVIDPTVLSSPTPIAPSDGTGTGNYLGFSALTLLLMIGIIVVVLRRRA